MNILLFVAFVDGSERGANDNIGIKEYLTERKMSNF